MKKANIKLRQVLDKYKSQQGDWNAETIDKFLNDLVLEKEPEYLINYVNHR
jgi:hypothetical protein